MGIFEELKSQLQDLDNFSFGAGISIENANAAIDNIAERLRKDIEKLKEEAKPNLYNSADDYYCQGVNQACDELEQKLFGGGDDTK